MTPLSKILILVLFVMASCQHKLRNYDASQYKKDSTAVYTYIIKGDSIYAQKASYTSFTKSLELYDIASQIALQTNDTALIAMAIFAKGRAYDAINNNPQKTINYYTQAAQLYATIPGKHRRALYIKHLVAHSYDKVEDSIHCIQILNELYSEINTLPDSFKKTLAFTVEMALISTVIKNYTFADSILHHLTQRSWIKNDTATYDYLNHYYLVKARIDVFKYHNYKSAYLDSVAFVFDKCKNLNDSVFYSMQLMELYKAANNYNKKMFYLQAYNDGLDKFKSPENIKEAADKVEKMEMAVVEAQRIAEKDKAETRKLSIYILIVLLLAIMILVVFLIRRNKQIEHKQKEVASINEQLNKKNIQNEILNKEVHHRVKNNLQMIMSLVYMQEQNTNTDEVKQNMQSIRLRIESIAKLHQQLMEQSEIIDLKKYIQYLVSNATNLMNDSKKVITHIDVVAVMLPQKISFPLGLIINEWVTNSIKYAQTENTALEIWVSITYSNNKLYLNYKDNGKPIKNTEVTNSLGLDIVNLLIQQIDADIIKEPTNLFNYNLIIPIDNEGA